MGALCLALLCAKPARADVIEDLYGNRLLFAKDGKPLVPVRMMERFSHVEMTARAGLEVTVGDHKSEVPAGGTLVVDRLSGQAAKLDRFTVLDTLERSDRARKKEVVARWRKRGLKVGLVPVGGVYGVKGTVIDNRALLVVSRDKNAMEVAQASGASATPSARLLELPSVKIRVRGAGGEQIAAGASGFVRVRAKDGGAILLRRVEHSIGYDTHGFEDRELREQILVVPDHFGKLAVVNLVHEAVLVAGILPSEMFASAPMEALKAQAVTARGELFAKIGRRHLTDPYLLCSEQHCQVYKGLTAERPSANKAAEETAGELAFLDGALVDSVYSACCGGHTEPSWAVWETRPKSALQGRVDAPLADPASRPWFNPVVASSLFAAPPLHGIAPALVAAQGPIPLDLRQEERVRAFLKLPREVAYCGRSSFNQRGTAWRWTQRFTVAELNARVAHLGVGAVKRIEIPERGPGGRLRRLRVVGQEKTVEVRKEWPVRRLLYRLVNGRRRPLNSGLFVIDEERDRQGRLVAVTLQGAGHGHGSGMCQQGAIGMAEAGATYKEILRHYYGGAQVERVF